MTAGGLASFPLKHRVLPELRCQVREPDGDVEIFRLSYHLRHAIITSSHRVRQVRHDRGVIRKHHVNQCFPTLRPQVACKTASIPFPS